MFGKIHQQFDVIIEAGKYPNLKAFPAHSLVLNVNSPYFQVEIAALSVTNLDKIIIKIPFIPPNIMETLLKYMYNGIICLDTDDNNEIMNLLVAAYDLGLQNACQDLQLYLIQKKSVWLLQNFAQTKKIAQQHEGFKRLQLFCDQIISNFPETIFMANDFHLLDPEVLISLLPRDDLAVNEIRIWMRLIEWGIAHTPNIKANSFLWTPQDFYALRKTLIPFVSFIRLFNIPFDDFRSKVLPFELILPKELVGDVINLHLDPLNYLVKSKILPPRHRPARTPLNITPVINEKLISSPVLSKEEHVDNEMVLAASQKSFSMSHIDNYIPIAAEP